jgi:hypothetical protein
LNLLSQLKSSVDVDITIIDVNEAPVCTLGLPVIPAVKVDSPVDTVIQNVTCNDPDVKSENKDLVYSIMGSQGIYIYIFLLKPVCHSFEIKDPRSRDRVLVGFTTTFAISAYHH